MFWSNEWTLFFIIDRSGLSIIQVCSDLTYFALFPESLWQSSSENDYLRFRICRNIWSGPGGMVRRASVARAVQEVAQARSFDRSRLVAITASLQQGSTRECTFIRQTSFDKLHSTNCIRQILIQLYLCVILSVKTRKLISYWTLSTVASTQIFAIQKRFSEVRFATIQVRFYP